MTELLNLMQELQRTDPHLSTDGISFRDKLVQACRSRGWNYETGYEKDTAAYSATVGSPIFRTAYSVTSETLAFAEAYKKALESVKPTPNAAHYGTVRREGIGPWVATESSKLTAIRDIKAGEEIIVMGDV
jgi:hypothetical protein